MLNVSKTNINDRNLKIGKTRWQPEAVPSTSTAKNTVISPDFMVWKFCGKAQYRPKLCGNCAFPQTFHTIKLGEITVFVAVIIKQPLTQRLREVLRKHSYLYKVFMLLWLKSYGVQCYMHCVKSVRIRSFSGPCFPAFGLNADQKISEYGHFSPSDALQKLQKSKNIELFCWFFTRIVFVSTVDAFVTHPSYVFL